MQYNIYFRKDNWGRFKDEPDKSKLINTLLATWYAADEVLDMPSIKKAIKTSSGLNDIYGYVDKKNASEAKKKAVRGDKAAAQMMGAKKDPITYKPTNNWGA